MNYARQSPELIGTYVPSVSSAAGPPSCILLLPAFWRYRASGVSDAEPINPPTAA